MAEYLTEFDVNSAETPERDFSLSETWLDTITNRPDQAKGDGKTISL